MKRRRKEDTGDVNNEDSATKVIKSYLNFVMQGEGLPALKYWSESGFEQFVSQVYYVH